MKALTKLLNKLTLRERYRLESEQARQEAIDLLHDVFVGKKHVVVARKVSLVGRNAKKDVIIFATEVELRGQISMRQFKVSSGRTPLTITHGSQSELHI